MAKNAAVITHIFWIEEIILGQLQQKTTSGLFWSFLDSFGSQVIRFGFGIAIARALSPTDYGIMGMIVIFISLGNLLTESGFGMALIQKKDATEADYSTVFWFNLFVAIIIYMFLFISAGKIADFYNQPLLIDVIRIVAFSIVLNALGIIHYTILNKKIEFKKQAYVRLGAVIPTGIIGVVLAYNGFAVWALVIQSLASGVITTFGIWFVHKWRPQFTFSIASFKELYKYGSKVFISGLLDVLFSKIYFPLIGKYFPVAQLGYYVKAEGFYRLIVRQVAIAYGRVTFPAFSSIQNEPERFLKNYLKIYRLLAFILFPLTFISIASSPSLIQVLLTDKWLPIVPFMKVFFIEGYFFSLYMLNINVFYAKGRSNIPLKIEIFKKALLILSVFIAFKYGIEALIWGQLISSFIVFIISTIIIRNLIDVQISYLAGQITPIISIIILSAVFNLVVFDYSYSTATPVTTLLMKIVTLPTLYIALSLIFNRQIIGEFADLFRGLIPSHIERGNKRKEL